MILTILLSIYIYLFRYRYRYIQVLYIHMYEFVDVTSVSANMGKQLFFAESLVGVLEMFFKEWNGEFLFTPTYYHVNSWVKHVKQFYVTSLETSAK